MAQALEVVVLESSTENFTAVVTVAVVTVVVAAAAEEGVVVAKEVSTAWVVPTVAVWVLPLAPAVMHTMLMTPMVLSVAEAATVATAEVTPMAKVLEPILGVVDLETETAAAATAVAVAVAVAVAAVATEPEPEPEPEEVVTASVTTMTTATIKMTTQMTPMQDEEVQVTQGELQGEGVGFRTNRTNHHHRQGLKQPRRLPHRKSVWLLLEAKPSRQLGSRGRYSRSAC